jgi:hypothetical protein
LYEEDLTSLEESLRRLKVEYEIFFNGNRKRPPDDLRGRVEMLVAKLSQAPNMGFSERYRLNTLVARFTMYRDLWRRNVSRLESGAVVPGRGSNPPKPKPGATAPDEVRIVIRDPLSEPGKVRTLYDTLVRLGGSRTQQAPRISYDQFATYVTGQAAAIRRKYNCSTVEFALALEADTIKFRVTAGQRSEPST